MCSTLQTVALQEQEQHPAAYPLTSGVGIPPFSLPPGMTSFLSYAASGHLSVSPHYTLGRAAYTNPL